MKHTCLWVKQNCTLDTPAVYCNQRVRYTMVLDDDRNRVRQYNPFCEEHMEKYRNEQKED